MREFFKRLIPYKWEMAGIILLRVISAAATLFMPYFMSEIVNEGITNKDMNLILQKGAIMLVLALVAMVTVIGTIMINTRLTNSFGASLQKDMFSKIMGMTFEDYSKIGTSSLITRCNEDVYTLQAVVDQISYILVSFPVLFIGGVILTMLKDSKTGLIMLLVSPLILLIVGLITAKMETLWENSDKYIDMQNKVVRERLSGLRVIRAFDKEDYEHDRIDYATKQMAYNIIQANVLSGVIGPLCMGLLNMLTVVILFLGARHLQAGSMITAGDIIASVQYIALIANGLMVLSWGIVFLPHMKVSLRRVAEVLNMPENQSGEGEGILPKSGISMKNLTFCYPGSEEPAVQDVNMEIGQGETVAVIGGTGSGKSTLVKLLLAFYRPTEGSICLGDRNYEELSRETVRDNIVAALQKSMIFEGTIASNIQMGYENASEEDMKKVCEIAQIMDFVDSHEEKFEYGLTQAGANISGGQKQRINIARTIIKPAAVYVFDDSFSALDYLTESKLRKALNVYLKGKTQIIITQRAATAMHCDKIYVMDNGRVVGHGTHQELMDTCSIYSEICRSQLGK